MDKLSIFGLQEVDPEFAAERRIDEDIRKAAEQHKAQQDAQAEAYLAVLNAIGRETTEAAPEPMPEPAPRQIKGFGGAFQAPDPNDPDVILHEPKSTRWDKARLALRDLETKLSALPADHPAHLRAVLEKQVENARNAMKRAEGDVARMRDGIDEWRKGAGHEIYKESRRNGNGTPHADTANMTGAQKEQHEKDMAFKRTFRSRGRKKGWTDDQIEAALIVKMRERAADEAAKAQEEADEAAMRADPRHGIF